MSPIYYLGFKIELLFSSFDIISYTYIKKKFRRKFNFIIKIYKIILKL